MSKRATSALIGIGLVLAGIAVGLVLLELTLRLIGFAHVTYHRPDDRLGLRLREGAEGLFTAEGQARIRINAAGFRDRERTEAKPAAAYRIAVLGDSYIEALQVDLERSFTGLLEQRLNTCPAYAGRRVEVLNFGVSSYGTAQQLLTFRHFASRYAPDLVIAAVFPGNDIRNNSIELEPDKLRPFFRVDGNALIEDRSFATSAEFMRRTNQLRTVLDRLRWSRVVQAAYLIKERLPMRHAGAPLPADAAAFEGGIDNAVYREPKDATWRDAWSVTERLLAQLDADVRAAGAKLLVVSLTSAIQVNPDAGVRRRFESAADGRDVTYPDRRMAAIAGRLGVESIALAPELRAIAERDGTYFHGFANTRLGTGHWNEAGHRAAADVVASRLCGDALTAAR